MSIVSISITGEKIKSQGDLFGVFFEDLNHAADGGLYGELLRNGSFEFEEIDHAGYTSLTAWECVGTDRSFVRAHVEYDQPRNTKKPHYLKMEVQSSGGAGIRNMGYGDGIFCKKQETYRFSCFAKKRRGTLKLSVRLEDRFSGDVLAESEIEVTGDSWKAYHCLLEANAECHCACLAVRACKADVVEIDDLSLFPVNTYRTRNNGLRKDIAEMIEAMHPRFMRFPGGCLTHIGSLDAADRCAMYRWKNTLGEVADRPSKRNNWNYNQSLGLGFFEFFLFCEDMKAEPLPAIAAGYDPHNLRMASLEDMQEWIDEALDLIEFANGPVTSKWGKIRAQMGHPESFHLKYLEIGNEEVGDGYFVRYDMIQKAVREKHPEIVLINSAGPGSGGSEFRKGWMQAREGKADLSDEHFYQCPEWFVANTDRYENYPPYPKVFLGEYGSQDDTWKNALSEAVFMTALEKAESVGMACYAPLLCNTDYTNWRPDLLYFKNDQVYGSPSYYVQKLFMNYQGEFLVGADDDMIPEKRERVKLGGSVVFRTEKAAVEIRDFEVRGFSSNEVLLKKDLIDLSPERSIISCGEVQETDYRILFSFCRRNGTVEEHLEGLSWFEVDFARRDDEHSLAWRMDGWQRMSYLNGIICGKTCDLGLEFFSSEIGRLYKAEIQVRGNEVVTYIDGQQLHRHDCKSWQPKPLYYSVVKDAEDHYICKLVNVTDKDQQVRILLPQGTDCKEAVIEYMDGYLPDERNSYEDPQKVIPRMKKMAVSGGEIIYRSKAYSIGVIRFR